MQQLMKGNNYHAALLPDMAMELQQGHLQLQHAGETLPLRTSGCSRHALMASVMLCQAACLT
jgi:hypothetical protein